jgi:ComF family protein
MCGRCIKKPPDFDYCQSLFRYEDDIIRLVHQLKFSDRLTCARTIGEMLSSISEQLIAEFGRPGCLMPVPLHSRRLRSRGYNQSIEIARVISGKEGIAIDRTSLIRQRSTSTQTGLDARSRLKNIKGAFRLNKKISYRHVLIIDDVVTTGATVNEIARLLKKNGVEEVGVLSFARAPIKS